MCICGGADGISYKFTSHPMVPARHTFLYSFFLSLSWEWLTAGSASGSHEIEVQVSAALLSSKSLPGVGELTFQGDSVALLASGAGYWSMSLLFCHMDFCTVLLEYPHHVLAGFPQKQPDKFMAEISHVSLSRRRGWYSQVR